MSKSFRTFLSRPRNVFDGIRKSFELKTPFEKVELVRKPVSLILEIIGINVLSDCKRNWRTPICAVTALQVSCLLFYTMQFYWAENKITALQPFAISAMAISSMGLYWEAVGPNRYRYKALVLFTHSNIYRNRHPSTDYERLCDKHAMNLIKHTIIMDGMVIISFSLIIVGPLYARLAHGEQAIPSGLIVPFIDPTSERGYAINFAIQFASVVASSIGNMSIEGIASMIINTFKVMDDLVRFNMREFSKGLHPKRFTNEQLAEFRNLIVQLQDLENYFKEVNEIYYWKFFLHPIATTVSVSLGIFSQMTNAFASGYGFALCTYFQFLGVCFMGNEVKKVCEKVAAELYEIKWHSMPLKYRKQLSAVLHRWQVGCNITVGPFEELNYGTASNMTKKIYSFIMLLKQTMNI